MSNVILLTGSILIDIDDIQELQGFEYQGKPDSDLSGKFLVRLVKKTPHIDIVCNSLSEAQKTYKNILKSRHIVDINEMRYGK